jgi:hypothetical protein
MSMKHINVMLIALASLISVSDLQAQLVWEVVLPAKVDPQLHRAVYSISCYGDHCIATTATYSPTIPNLSMIFASTNGGFSWSQVAADFPQWDYLSTGGRRGLTFDPAQQIDSLNAVIADGFAGWVAFTHDGWKTWRLDSSLAEIGGRTIAGVFFASAAEGMLWKPFGFFWSTIDSGKTWKEVAFSDGASNGVACQSYGNKTFRVVDNKQRIFTTYDNWSTWDTTHMSLNGPLADTSFHFFQCGLSRSDTIIIWGWRWDATSTNKGALAIALSTDLGQTWDEVDLPRNNGIYYATTNPIPVEWKQHMVLTGKDSVGRILQTFDGGIHWRMDTVALSTQMPYYKVYPATVSSSGRVIAAVSDISAVYGSASLAYLKVSKASVKDADRNYQYLYIGAYPNPVHDILSLKMLGMIVGPVSTLRSRIYDVLGRTVRDLSKQAQAGSNGDFSEFDTDVSDLAPGVYFVSYTLGGAEYVRQFLKY